jgi:hypothetical protein
MATKLFTISLCMESRRISSSQNFMLLAGVLRHQNKADFSRLLNVLLIVRNQYQY